MNENYNKNLANNVKSILSEIGENSEREGLLKTPERVAKSMTFLTKGYKENPSKVLKSAMFAENYSQMVLVKDIELYSLCEHHMLPFFGKAHIAYIPVINQEIIGLSKLNRIVEHYARRGAIQENLTVRIHDAINKIVENNKGVAVMIEASHNCVQCRGVGHQGTSMRTSKLTGEFIKSNKTRNEFYEFVKS